MNLSHRESRAAFATMRELCDALDHRTLRQRLGEPLLALLGADHFVCKRLQIGVFPLARA